MNPAILEPTGLFAVVRVTEPLQLSSNEVAYIYVKAPAVSGAPEALWYCVGEGAGWSWEQITATASSVQLVREGMPAGPP